MSLSDMSGFGDIPFADDVLEVPSLRDRLQPRISPLKECERAPLLGYEGFVSDDDRVKLQALAFGSESSAGATCVNGMSVDDACVPLPEWGYRSGPRETIYFDPAEVKVAIVTCGGLCPGLNDVVHGIVQTLFKDYGLVKGQVLGIRYGFRGFYEGAEPIELCPKTVQGIHLVGGTILGTTRGGSDTGKIVDAIHERGINMVFVIGGNGGNAGANAIHEECSRRDMPVSVVGVPKSIDNDILLIDKCFGFDTAVEQAQVAIEAAYVEARSAYNGIGLVKLMGRQSGFIAAMSSLSFQEVDLCLIPEVSFALDGPNGVTAYVERVLEEKGHMLIVVAEGAGQDILSTASLGTDASGNPVLADIGLWLKKQLKSSLKLRGVESDIKYIDPSYMIRGVPTNPADRIMCLVLVRSFFLSSLTLFCTSGPHAFLRRLAAGGNRAHTRLHRRRRERWRYNTYKYTHAHSHTHFSCTFDLHFCRLAHAHTLASISLCTNPALVRSRRRALSTERLRDTAASQSAS